MKAGSITLAVKFGFKMFEVGILLMIELFFAFAECFEWPFSLLKCWPILVVVNFNLAVMEWVVFLKF